MNCGRTPHARERIVVDSQMGFEWGIARDGGLDHVDINELNHALRLQLRSHGRDHARPIELVKQRLADPRGPAIT